MQLLNAFQVAILAASQVSAVPITGADSIASNPMNELTKRANPAPVSCGRKLSPWQQIKRPVAPSYS